MAQELKILVINGPNLNLLGKREPDVYGNQSFEDYFSKLQFQFKETELSYFQSNSEGDLITKIQDADGVFDGIVLNAAGVGITAQTKRLAQAKALVKFLISQKGQKMFASVNKEYPLNANVDAASELKPLKSFQVASVPLSRLAELRDPTMTVIEHVGLR